MTTKLVLLSILLCVGITMLLIGMYLFGTVLTVMAVCLMGIEAWAAALHVLDTPIDIGLTGHDYDS